MLDDIEMSGVFSTVATDVLALDTTYVLSADKAASVVAIQARA